MRILGIDHGSVRIGLALSDELGWTAQPLSFIEADKLSHIVEIVRQREVTRIVVGLPRNVSRAKRKQKIDSMAAQLMLQSYLDAHGG